MVPPFILDILNGQWLRDRFFTSSVLARSALSMPCLPPSNPVLDLRKRQSKGSTGFGHRRLALDDVQHQRALALGRLTLDFLFHPCTRHLPFPEV